MADNNEPKGIMIPITNKWLKFKLYFYDKNEKCPSIYLKIDDDIDINNMKNFEWNKTIENLLEGLKTIKKYIFKFNNYSEFFKFFSQFEDNPFKDIKVEEGNEFSEILKYSEQLKQFFIRNFEKNIFSFVITDYAATIVMPSKENKKGSLVLLKCFDSQTKYFKCQEKQNIISMAKQNALEDKLIYLQKM